MKTMNFKSGVLATAGATTTVDTDEGDVVLVMNITDEDLQRPQQVVTVGDYPAGNSNWVRAIRLVNDGFMCLRNGANSVAMLLACFTKCAILLEPSLTWKPKITSQPSAGTVVADGSHLDFTVVVSSELPVTYAWYESADGVTWGSALTTTGIYDVSVAGRLRITPQQAYLTSNNTNVSNGDTVVIGAKTYTFKTALTPSEGEVLIGGSADASLLNLINAINHTGTPDTDYSCAAANADVVADAVVAAHKIRIAAKAAGTYATTTTAGTLSWTAATVTSKTGYVYKSTITNAAGSTDSVSVQLTVS
jgi:hypothetical protein